jgi:peptidoglycan/LPS O-acetylase OafA/YrhL
MNPEEQKLKSRTAGERFVSLDALRGIAALTVVVSHLLFAFREPPAPLWLYPLLAGDAAVLLFFVLSGFVLSLRYWSHREETYLIFLVRRVCRIYVPFLPALVFAALCAVWFIGVQKPLLTSWYNGYWQMPLTPEALFSQVVLWPSPVLNGVFWTLRFELQASYVMPLVCLVLRRVNAPAAFALLATAIFASDRWQHYLSWHLMSQAVTILVYFVLGAVLAKHRHDLQGLWARMGAAGQWMLLGVSLLLFWRLPNHLVPAGAMHAWLLQRGDLEGALGAGGVLISALYLAKFRKLLEHPIPEYLGRISFSLYLTHMPVMGVLFDLSSGHLPVWALVILDLVTAFTVAHLFCIGIEEPAIRLGRRWADMLKQWQATHLHAHHA